MSETTPLVWVRGVRLACPPDQRADDATPLLAEGRVHRSLAVGVVIRSRTGAPQSRGI